MKNIYLILLISFFSATAFSQKVDVKLGASVYATNTNAGAGFLPGIGMAIDNRIEFKGSNFELKNHLGFEIIKNSSENLKHTFVKFGVMGEYNFFTFGTINRYGNDWTPYVGLGLNVAHYNTSTYNKDLEEAIEDKDGFTVGSRASLGIKYKLSEKMVINIETALDLDYSDALDGNDYVKYITTNTIILSLGLTYSL